MKLGADFGRVPFGVRQVLAFARRRRIVAFGNLTAGQTAERDRRAGERRL